MHFSLGFLAQSCQGRSLFKRDPKMPPGMMHWDVHHGISYNRQKLETTQVSISWGLVKLIMEHPYPYSSSFVTLGNDMLGKNTENVSYHQIRQASRPEDTKIQPVQRKWMPTSNAQCREIARRRCTSGDALWGSVIMGGFFLQIKAVILGFFYKECTLVVKLFKTKKTNKSC